ncbi:hypothetical protein Bpfe_019110, partial [Biomphalaria pfeifferi]
TDGCQPTLEATEMQWLEEELADFKLAPHGIQRYTDAIRDNPRFKSLKHEMNTLFETLLKELLEEKRVQDRFWKGIADSIGYFIESLRKAVIQEEEKKKKLLAEREKARQRELQRQKEEEEKKRKAKSRRIPICLWKICQAAPWD